MVPGDCWSVMSRNRAVRVLAAGAGAGHHVSEVSCETLDSGCARKPLETLPAVVTTIHQAPVMEVALVGRDIEVGSNTGTALFGWRWSSAADLLSP